MPERSTLYVLVPVAPLLASLDRPFAVEEPDELRNLVAALASRLAASARSISTAPGWRSSNPPNRNT